MNNRKNLLRLLLFVSLSFVAVILNGQTVSKTFKNEALKTVLKEVEKQTGLSVIYKTDEVNENKKITATFKNTPINTVLDKILDEGLTYKLQNKMIVISKKEQPLKQSVKKVVTGVVVDAAGEPVIGAAVMLKGTTIGTITDMTGNYTIEVPAEGVLVISYVGYKTLDIRANDIRALSKITLHENSKMIDEVVVVGYGVQRKRDVSTAISSIRASDIADVAATSIEQALVGRMAGVQITQPNGTPGAGFEVKVRGVGTVTAGSSPLYVIDGVPLSDDTGDATGITVSPLASIETSDIESIEV